VVVIAGTLTTAAALSEITYHLLRQPDELKTLKDELAKAIPDPTALQDAVKLEQLPYLTGVIKEGLRLSSGISTRLQRIATDETLIYTAKARSNDKKRVSEKQYVLRPGIPLSMTGLLIHHSPTYFEDPMTFRPQRWLDNPSLDNYLVPFSSRHQSLCRHQPRVCGAVCHDCDRVQPVWEPRGALSEGQGIPGAV